MDYIYPEKVLDHQEAKLVCMCSFPDSNAFSSEGSLKYVFKFRREKISQEYFGYSFFKQYKDPSNPRGYSQKSFVLLTKHAHIIFFKKFLDILHEASEEREEEIGDTLKKAFEETE